MEKTGKEVSATNEIVPMGCSLSSELIVIVANFCPRSALFSALLVEAKEFEYIYSQLSPYGHLAIADTPIIRSAAKSRAKINYRRLSQTFSLLRTLANEDTNWRSLQCPLLREVYI